MIKNDNGNVTGTKGKKYTIMKLSRTFYTNTILWFRKMNQHTKHDSWQNNDFANLKSIVTLMLLQSIIDKLLTDGTATFVASGYDRLENEANVILKLSTNPYKNIPDMNNQS